MITYHVWLTGQVRPEIVRAYGVEEREGNLYFSLGSYITQSGEALDVNLIRHIHPGQWQRWAVVQDDADLQHL